MLLVSPFSLTAESLAPSEKVALTVTVEFDEAFPEESVS